MSNYLKRPDLINCGRTLIGAPPIRGQQQDINYYGSIPLRIKAFFKDVQKELWAVGVSLSTLHNEVFFFFFSFFILFFLFLKK